jgi:protein TonB
MTGEERVKAERCTGGFNGCLVEGDVEENARERKIKRRAIGISVALQTAGLAVLVIAPLFAKPAELSERIAVPIPPYSHRAVPRNSTRTATDRTTTQVCLVCPGARVRPVVSTGQSIDQLDPPGLEVEPTGLENPNAPLNVIDSRSQPRRPDDPPREKRRVHLTQIDPALLVRRVEPLFPPLARQLRQSGKVELRAVVGIDGSIQELQVVSGHPLFVTSALEAVKQWRYRPTYLNGQPVEIDTYITVIYTLQ